MDDAALLTALVRAQYELPVLSLMIMSGALDAGRAIFRLDGDDGPAWLGRAYRYDLPVPDWLAGCDADDMPSWLHSRALTLRHLEALAYPAPRVIPDRSGALIGTSDGWHLLITTFVAGQVIDPTPESLHGLGAALGQLHRLTIEQPDASALAGRSWWHVERAVPAALAQFALVAANLPPRWRPLAASFSETLETIAARRDLPQSIIHGDGWAGNAVQTASGATVLIDWEMAGRGLAILDLGRSLLYNHYDLAPTFSVPIQPSVWRINALVAGYCGQRIPTPAEREALLAAIRFGVACGAATHLVAAYNEGWRDPQPEPLVRRERWYAVAAPIAELAQQQLDRLA
jgi:Ser/Thr protein kinase RdoA (MazF antagonist)